jgi:hypothetical protein
MAKLEPAPASDPPAASAAARAPSAVLDLHLGEMDVRLLGAPPATAGSGAAP